MSYKLDRRVWAVAVRGRFRPDRTFDKKLQAEQAAELCRFLYGFRGDDLVKVVKVRITIEEDS